MRRFEFVEGSSSKFWEIEEDGSSFTVRWGRIGTSGQSQTKAFADAQKALAEAGKLVKEKLSKGYTEVTTGAVVVPASDRPVATAQKAPRATAAAPPAAAPSTPAAPAAIGTTATPSAHAAEAMAAIVWTPAMQARVHPRRAHHPPTPVVNLEVIRTGFNDATMHDWLQRTHAAGNARSDKLLNAIKSTPRDRLPELAEVDVEAARVTVFHYRQDKLLPAVVAWWAEQKGPLYALQALLASQGMRFLNLRFDAEPAPADVKYLDLEAFASMRAVLAAAPQSAWDEAHQHAAQLRATLRPLLRIGVAYLFPEEATWNEEAAAEAFEGKTINQYAIGLLASLSHPGLLAEVAARVCRLGEGAWWGARFWPGYLPSMVDLVGAEAVPALAAMFAGSKQVAHKSAALEALALIRNRATAVLFYQHFSEKPVVKIATNYFQQAPQLFVEAVVATKKAPADAALALLRQLKPDLSGLDAKSRALFGGSSAAASVSAGTNDEASAQDLPPMLASPPWRRTKKRTPTVLPSLSVPPLPARLHGDDWDQFKLPLHSHFRKFYVEPSTERDSALLTQYQTLLQSDPAARHPQGAFRQMAWIGTGNLMIATILDMTDAVALQTLREAPAAVLQARNEELGFVLLGRFGLEVVPVLARALPAMNQYFQPNFYPALMRIESTELVPLMLDFAAGREEQRVQAEAWMLAFPTTMATGLLPIALGPMGTPRTRAENILRFLARRGHGSVVRQVAAGAGHEAAAVIDEILDSDIGFDKVPKLPAFWQPDDWTRPRLKNGKALPLATLEEVGVILAVSTLDDPHAGVSVLRETCDAASLAGFTWDLFAAWLAAGGAAQQNWAFTALAWFADEAALRRLISYMYKWTAEGAAGKNRTMVAIDVLRHHGSDFALFQLHRYGQNAKVHAIQRKVEEALQQAAEARQLSKTDLEDRLVPDLGLDEDGSTRYDFGSRVLTVRFDEQLKPHLLDEQGNVLPQFPRASKNDDANKVKAASAAWKLLVGDAERVAAAQIRRLEQAMCNGRRWQRDVFESCFVRHPLIGHLARRLLWAVYDASGQRLACFRIAEDRTYTDAADADLALPQEAVVGMPHILELSSDETAKWGSLFADYAIVQPFPQLGRDTYARDQPPPTGGRCRSGRLLGLTNRGWQMSVDDGFVHGMEKRCAHGVTVLINFSPGWDPQHRSDEEQTVEKLSCYGRDLSALSPVEFSELMRDYLWLLST
jgi:predicted DNA-binding WGR domain protein